MQCFIVLKFAYKLWCHEKEYRKLCICQLYFEISLSFKVDLINNSMHACRILVPVHSYLL